MEERKMKEKCQCFLKLSLVDTVIRSSPNKINITQINQYVFWLNESFSNHFYFLNTQVLHRKMKYLCLIKEN